MGSKIDSLLADDGRVAADLDNPCCITGPYCTARTFLDHVQFLAGATILVRWPPIVSAFLLNTDGSSRCRRGRSWSEKSPWPISDW